MIPTVCSSLELLDKKFLYLLLQKYQNNVKHVDSKKQNSIKGFNILIYFMTATANKNRKACIKIKYDNKNTQL